MKYIMPEDEIHLRSARRVTGGRRNAPSLSRRAENDCARLWPAARVSFVVLYVANHVTTMTIRSAAMRHERESAVTGGNLCQFQPPVASGWGGDAHLRGYDMSACGSGGEPKTGPYRMEIE